MHFIKIPALLLYLVLTTTTSYSAQTACPEHFANGQAPDFTNRKLLIKAREVCYSGFALKHSGITRTPLYAAEHLTRDHMLQGRGLKRQSTFHPDEHIPAYERAELRNYARSGYDRGHAAPSADMFDIQSQQECFTLANMVPQVPENNRGPWEGVESAVRKLARNRGELYIVTGPVFSGENLQRIGGAVMVPTQLFKAVYDPNRQEAGAYLIDNTADARPQKITIAGLEKVTGITLFPALSERIRSAGMDLPDPRPFKERKHQAGWL